ncbi:steroid 17-alpha-hydroxylase/17,20 lyase-like [Oppia nitens]|uniref:steroid 17-alpha-hydroxylase/17,20 lyase-like n=1 Tax=Oppia nitens TaxID=1686743 RepID=UPI0023DB5F4E|nr:steroid 17-alpha-hydroxylase/17,20 lyase-like [Oppia nitens]
MNDKDTENFKYCIKGFRRENNVMYVLMQFIPAIRFLNKSFADKQNQTFKQFIDNMKQKFMNHYNEYDPSVCRDFCDSLIAAKEEAIRESKESAPYLADKSLVMAIFDLFFAGTDTSQLTFLWMLLFMSYYPQTQKQLRQEIDTQIGDRLPTHEDRQQCHYVMAFITETLRFRNVAPIGVPHRAVVRTKVGDYTLQKDTTVVLLQSVIMTDDNYWPNANKFTPERFLSNGKYINSRSKAFIPFGVGRRVCLGEKLAIADLFLVLIRFLQTTNDYDIVLESHKGLDPNVNIADSLEPNKYEISLKRRL